MIIVELSPAGQEMVSGSTWRKKADPIFLDVILKIVIRHNKGVDGQLGHN